MWYGDRFVRRAPRPPRSVMEKPTLHVDPPELPPVAVRQRNYWAERNRRLQQIRERQLAHRRAQEQMYRELVEERRRHQQAMRDIITKYRSPSGLAGLGSLAGNVPLYAAIALGGMWAMGMFKSKRR